MKSSALILRTCSLLCLASWVAACGTTGEGPETYETQPKNDAGGADAAADVQRDSTEASLPADAATDGTAPKADVQPDRGAAETGSSAPTWAKSIGGAAGEDFSSVTVNASGEILALGATGSYAEALSEAFLVKYDAQGELLSQDRYGAEKNDAATAALALDDGGYLVVGSTESGLGARDIWVFRIDSAGAVAWSKTYGGTGDEWAQAVVSDGADGFVVAGSTESFGAGGRDGWVMHLDSAGTPSWQRAFGGADMDTINGLVKTPTGYGIAGFTKSYTKGMADFWVANLQSDGTLGWSRSIGGDNHDYGLGLAVSADGSLTAAGWSASIVDPGQTVYALYVTSFDSSGTLVWQRGLDGPDLEQANAIISRADGGYVMAGTTWSYGAGGKDFFVLGMTAAGHFDWQKTYGVAGWDWAHGVARSPDNTWVIAGYTSFGAGAFDGWVLKVDETGGFGGNCVANMGKATNAMEMNTQLAVSDAPVEQTDTAVTPADFAATRTPADGKVAAQCSAN